LVPDQQGPGGIVRLYGIRVFENGIVYSSDRRRRWRGDTNLLLGVPPRAGKKRRAVRAFSEASRRRLEFIAANTATVFRSLLSLTYHAPACSWSNPEENAHVAKRSKTDLNRFLSCLREELGSYLWVQEFQKRGAIHCHVLCEREIEAERVTCRSCRRECFDGSREGAGTCGSIVAAGIAGFRWAPTSARRCDDSKRFARARRACWAEP
jgi:hypothetical protein